MLSLRFSNELNKNVIIEDAELACIININITKLSPDGAEGCFGGMSKVIYYSPTPSLAFRGTLNQTSACVGRGLPPWFQFPPRARTENVGSTLEMLEKRKLVGEKKVATFQSFGTALTEST